MESLSNPTKKSAKQNFEKVKKVEPLPAIEKKPPVPSNNRSKDPHSFLPKPNYHYRNKNEVTGKITQMPNASQPRGQKIDRNTKQSFSSEKITKKTN